MRRARFVLFALGATVASCRRGSDAHPKAAASASASAEPATGVVAVARERHFEAELARARQEWTSKPSLDCTTLTEKSDVELCTAANQALSQLRPEVDPAFEHVLPALEGACLALARLSERVRYLSLAELARKRVQDAGPTTPHAWSAGSSSGPAASRPRALELREGPISQLMTQTIRLERAALRNLGAYLEYAPEIAVRRSSFDAVLRLRRTRPQWTLLDSQLREAALLESDEQLKRELEATVANGLPRERQRPSSADSR